MKDYEGAGIKSGIYHGKRLYPVLLYPTLCNIMDCSPPGSSGLWICKNNWSGLPFPSPYPALVHLNSIKTTITTFS